MYEIVSIILSILCIVTILIVTMQPMKTNAASSLSGGAEELFVRRKSRGFEAFLQRLTFILLAIFFLLTISLMYISSFGI